MESRRRGRRHTGEGAERDYRVGFHPSRHASPLEGTLTPNQVYALTAYLLALNKIIPEDQVLDQNNLAKVKMPIGNEWVRVPDWKARSAKTCGVSLLAPNCSGEF